MTDFTLITEAPKGRIFFFGAHKLLVKTELGRLRELGYEVFNPPYLSHVLDQSADYRWNKNQISTLPEEVFEKLSRYSFFYNHIDDEISEILNEYFDVVVVTLVARWAAEVARFFKGRIIFRSYGQTSLISDNFAEIGGRAVVEKHGDFIFCPFATESLDQEEDWLTDRSVVIPYCLSSDIFLMRDRWLDFSTERSGNILLTTPNIAGNIFHLSHYQFVKEYFYQDYFKLCGVQFSPVSDPQVVGTLKREDQMDLFLKSSGYLYTYSDPRVSYLPPIEMAVFGGPVMYLQGSLLARFIGAGGPGEAATIEAAQALALKAREADPVWISELRSAQSSLVDRYDPDVVWPVFDREMLNLLPTSSTKLAVRPRLSAGVRLKALVGSVFEEAETNLPYAGPQDALLDGLALIDGDCGDKTRSELTKDLREHGALATFSQTVLAAHGDRDRPLRSVIGRQSNGIVREVIGRSNYLSHGCKTNIGRILRDPESGSVLWVADQGTPGYLCYGPYISIGPGRYSVSFTIMAEGPETGLGELDVIAQGEPLSRAIIARTVAGPTIITIEFQTDTPKSGLEFRVISNGAGRLTLSRITLQEAG